LKNIETQIREETLRHFQGSKEVGHEPKRRVFSPNQKYYFDATTYSKPIDDGVTFGNYFTTKIEIFDNLNKEKMFEFLRNDAYSPHLWLEIEGTAYLLLSEFQYGMSVFNLIERRFKSSIGSEDRHQIIEYYPSPDLLKMAVVEVQYGNFPKYRVSIYDISRPFVLPYPLVYKSDVADNQRVESLKWLDGMYVDVLYREEIRIGKTSLKVEVFEVFDDDFMLRCRFKDIHGKEYICTEKVQAMIGSIDENTKFPFMGSIDVGLIKKYTLSKQKIGTISVDLGFEFHEAHNIDVYENQLETYWYHKDYIT
jgi:hypothetical protein